MNTDNKINDNLKDVIERNIDAYKGYEKASEKVQSAQLVGSFKTQAQQRKKFALELEAEAQVYDADTRQKIEDGSFEGNVHRTWMDIKTALSSDKDEAVLEECIRGEKEALEEYDELINQTNFKGEPHSLITQQRATVQACLNELELMEKALD